VSWVSSAHLRGFVPRPTQSRLQRWRVVGNVWEFDWLMVWTPLKHKTNVGCWVNVLLLRLGYWYIFINTKFGYWRWTDVDSTLRYGRWSNIGIRAVVSRDTIFQSLEGLPSWRLRKWTCLGRISYFFYGTIFQHLNMPKESHFKAAFCTIIDFKTHNGSKVTNEYTSITDIIIPISVEEH